MKYLSFNNLSLTGKIWKKIKFCAVENTVGEVADPVAQADYPAVFGDTDIVGNMTVTEHKVFNIGMFFMLFPGILHLVLTVCSPESSQGSVFLAALF